ncbi:hypothetical protein JOS77_12035 [Chromobacterium haemolyticum]|nr:hypothetical protein JOS77_12035 [Chromobacterium haemolyticum]
MNPLMGEFIGTALLVLLGNGVVANVLLKNTKGHNSGLIVIALVGRWRSSSACSAWRRSAAPT